MKRVVVTLHLPMEMGAAARIMKAVAREFKDSVVGEPSSGDGRMEIHAEAEPVTVVPQPTLRPCGCTSNTGSQPDICTICHHREHGRRACPVPVRS